MVLQTAQALATRMIRLLHATVRIASFNTKNLWDLEVRLPVAGLDHTAVQELLFVLQCSVDPSEDQALAQGDIELAQQWLGAVQLAQVASDRLLHDLRVLERNLCFWQQQISGGAHTTFMMLGRGPSVFAAYLGTLLHLREQDELSATDQLQQRLLLLKAARPFLAEALAAVHLAAGLLRLEHQHAAVTAHMSSTGHTAADPPSPDDVTGGADQVLKAARTAACIATANIRSALEELQLRMQQLLHDGRSKASLRPSHLLQLHTATSGGLPRTPLSLSRGSGGRSSSVRRACTLETIPDDFDGSSFSGRLGGSGQSSVYGSRSLHSDLCALQDLLGVPHLLYHHRSRRNRQPASHISTHRAFARTSSLPAATSTAPSSTDSTFKAAVISHSIDSPNSVTAASSFSQGGNVSTTPATSATPLQVRFDPQTSGGIEPHSPAPHTNGVLAGLAILGVGEEPPLEPLHAVQQPLSPTRSHQASTYGTASKALDRAHRAAAHAGPLVILPEWVLMPSQLQLHWLRYLAGAIAVGTLARFLYNHSRLTGKDDLDRWCETAVTASRDTIMTHIFDPLVTVRNELFKTFRDRPSIVSVQEFEADKQSLLRMLADFQVDSGRPGAAEANKAATIAAMSGTIDEASAFIAETADAAANAAYDAASAIADSAASMFSSDAPPTATTTVTTTIGGSSAAATGSGSTPVAAATATTTTTVPFKPHQQGSAVASGPTPHTVALTAPHSSSAHTTRAPTTVPAAAAASPTATAHSSASSAPADTTASAVTGSSAPVHASAAAAAPPVHGSTATVKGGRGGGPVGIPSQVPPSPAGTTSMQESDALIAGMAALMENYEDELKHPVRNLLWGQLARAVLIQVQRLKVDTEAAMLELDQILKANELSISLVAAVPALAITWGVLSTAVRWLTPQAPDMQREAVAVRMAMVDLEKALLAAVAVPGAEAEGWILYQMHRVYREALLLYRRHDRTSRQSEWPALWGDLLQLARPATAAERLMQHERILRRYKVFRR